jgi:hypothetical protein
MFPFHNYVYVSCNRQIYRFYMSQYYILDHTIHMGSESEYTVRGFTPVWLCMVFRTAQDTITIICTHFHSLSYSIFYGPASNYLFFFDVMFSRGLMSSVTFRGYVKRNLN